MSFEFDNLKVNSTLITDQKKVAALIATNLSENYSAENSASDFQSIQMIKKMTFLLKMKNISYNLPFSVTELKQWLQRANDCHW